jgi:hypothetical protein
MHQTKPNQWTKPRITDAAENRNLRAIQDSHVAGVIYGPKMELLKKHCRHINEEPLSFYPLSC